MRLLFLVPLLELLAVVLGIDFINPAPFGTYGDYTLNALYPMGSQVNVQWTAGPTGNKTALTMFQLKGIGSALLGDLEYLQQNIDPRVTSFSWTVNTTKNLAISNMFFLCLFIQGNTTASANSHYFNITSNDVKSASTTTPRSASTSTSSAATTSTSIESTSSASHPPMTSLSSATASMQAPAIPPSKSSCGVLNNVTKAAISLGISFAAILSIVVGWVFWGRKRRQDLQRSIALSSYEPPKWQPPHVYQLDAKTSPTHIYELESASEARE